jgi:hypothetical protein
MPGSARKGGIVTLIVGIALALGAVPAGAATVVNGGFETGTLEGWTLSNSNEDGSWYAYSGTDSPESKANPLPPFEPEEEVTVRQVPPPPEGIFGALADQSGPGRRILYQDLALEAGASHLLSMVVYYDSNAPIAVPTPDSLDPGPDEGEIMLEAEEPLSNQQYRVEVIKPTAPLETVNPEDILATVFRTLNGSPNELGPTTVTADLSAFAGQTVRLRLAEVDNQGNFTAGADSVSIDSRSLPIVLGKLRRNRKKGTAKLAVKVPGPGQLKIDDATPTDGYTQPAWAAPVRGKGDKLKLRSVAAAAAGTVMLPMVPTARGRKSLRKKHELSVRARVIFLPSGTGVPGVVQDLKGKLRMKAPRALPKPARKR